MKLVVVFSYIKKKEKQRLFAVYNATRTPDLVLEVVLMVKMESAAAEDYNLLRQRWRQIAHDIR